MSNILEAALSYAARGWLVFPCQPKTKIPATQHGFKDATLDPAQIKAWWTQCPEYNVAIATGEASGLFVLDVDEKPGRTLGEAIADLPKIPDAPTVRTGGGGLQYFFNFPQVSGLSISGGRLGVGIDTRGNGGYVVAPPSIHPHGPTYQWIDLDDDEIIPHPPDAPEWICERLQKQKTAAIKLSGEKITGGRHDTLMTAAALMRSIGLVPAEILAALEKMVDRMDMSDGRKWQPRELENIANWCGDKSVGEVNFESVAHGEKMAGSLLKKLGTGLQEVITASTVKFSDPGRPADGLFSIPGILDSWVEWINKTSMRIQPELAFAAVLTACGALIGRRFQTATGGRANIYSLGFCETGGGKERARQGVKEVLTMSGNDKLIGPEDFASESGLISSLVHSPCLLFQIDEIGKLLAAINSPNAGSHLVGIISAFLKLYSSANSIYKGKAYADPEKNPVINQPHACLYGTATPEAWESLGVGALEDGLLGRLWVFQAVNNRPPRQHPQLLPPPSDLVKKLTAWAQSAPGSLEIISPKPKTVERTPEAHAIMERFADRCDEPDRSGNSSSLSKLWVRSAQKADQLALIYAWSVNQESPVIDATAAEWAVKCADYLTHVLVFQSSRHVAANKLEGDFLAIERFIADAKSGRTKTEILTKFRRLGKRGLGDAVDLLTEQGVIEINMRESKGRPVAVFTHVQV